MPAIDRSLDAVAFVSEHFRDIVRRRLSEIAGLALITLALLGSIALATWSVQDPSLSHATQTPVHNLLGFPGAIFADLAMQLLGLASVMLLLPEMLLGWRLLAHKPVGDKWRGLLWILATFLAAAFVSTLPRLGSWPLPTGLGGVFGDALLRAPAFVFGAHFNGLALFLTAVFFGLASAATIAFAAGLIWPRRDAGRKNLPDIEDDIDEEESDGASAWLGMIVHALLSWKARAGRLLRGTLRTPLPAAMPAAAGARQEPRFDAHGRVTAPVAPDFRRRGGRRGGAARRAPPRRAASGAAPFGQRLCAALAQFPHRAARLRTHHAVERPDRRQ